MDEKNNVTKSHKELLANHIKSCVVEDIRAGNIDVVDDLVCTLQKLMK